MVIPAYMASLKFSRRPHCRDSGYVAINAEMSSNAIAQPDLHGYPSQPKAFPPVSWIFPSWTTANS